MWRLRLTVVKLKNMATVCTVVYANRRNFVGLRVGEDGDEEVYVVRVKVRECLLMGLGILVSVVCARTYKARRNGSQPTPSIYKGISSTGVPRVSKKSKQKKTKSDSSSDSLSGAL
ncbi:hypothetical protein Fmac_010951 [Flemingia macrophylla]|uniref:Transmembrane protein n=1 Tax=Flemingia macrophylla TaxID=520843 RepID=A0ABD1ML20_9FABA